jgi:hypothetical protein
MTLRFHSIVVGLMSVALSACAGNAAMQAARDAHYEGDRNAMLDAVLATVQSRYQVADVKSDAGLIITYDRWYEKDGTFEDKALASDTNYALADGSILLRYQVQLHTDGAAYRVEVTPIIRRHMRGSPAPYTLKPDDLEVPGWITGKTEHLTLAIYDALAPYRVAPNAAVAAR